MNPGEGPFAIRSTSQIFVNDYFEDKQRVSTAIIPPSSGMHSPADSELIRIRDLIYQVAGIFHPDTKLRLLLDGCSRRMAEIRVKTLGEYFGHLTVKCTRQKELIALLNEVTIGETCFFRNQAQLNALRQIILPKIIRAKAASPIRRLRIWSAGCSTGEEPYTLSMVLQEESERLKEWHTEIMATDLNERSLMHAGRALYSAHSTRHVTPYYQEKYFRPVENELEVQLRVRNDVKFSRLNLSDDDHMSLMTDMDLMFCCNVLIYFDFASKQRVLDHFYRNLLPHGYLFLGQTESLYGVSDRFRLIHLPGTTAYIKGDESMSTGQGSL